MHLIGPARSFSYVSLSFLVASSQNKILGFGLWALAEPGFGNTPSSEPSYYPQLISQKIAMYNKSQALWYQAYLSILLQGFLVCRGHSS